MIITLKGMNIFFLHKNPAKSAKYYFNKHCIKIILEIAQMLYTAHWTIAEDDTCWIDKHIEDITLNPYKKTHYNHPTSKWIRNHRNNYLYACVMGLSLCYEYTHRYNKVHKTQARLEWLIHNIPSVFTPVDNTKAYLATENIPSGCTPIPLAMPVEYHSPDVIASYRAYYIHEKKSIAQSEQTWTLLKEEWCI